MQQCGTDRIKNSQFVKRRSRENLLFREPRRFQNVQSGCQLARLHWHRQSSHSWNEKKKTLFRLLYDSFQRSLRWRFQINCILYLVDMKGSGHYFGVIDITEDDRQRLIPRKYIINIVHFILTSFEIPKINEKFGKTRIKVDGKFE